MLETSNQQGNSKGKLIKRCNHRFPTRQSCKIVNKVHTDIFYLKNLFVTLYITKWFHRGQSKLYVCMYVEAIGLRSFIRFFGQVWWDSSRRVRTHEKNSKYAVRRWGTIHNIFLCPIRSQHSLDRAWKLYVASFVPTRLTVPWSLGLGEVGLGLKKIVFYLLLRRGIFQQQDSHIVSRILVSRSSYS